MTIKEINEYLWSTFAIDMQAMKQGGDYIGTRILFDWCVFVWFNTEYKKLELMIRTPAPYAEKSRSEIEKMLEQKFAECEQVAQVKRLAHERIDIWFK